VQLSHGWLDRPQEEAHEEEKALPLTAIQKHLEENYR
jgi:hypothetical protein